MAASTSLLGKLGLLLLVLILTPLAESYLYIASSLLLF